MESVHTQKAEYTTNQSVRRSWLKLAVLIGASMILVKMAPMVVNYFRPETTQFLTEGRDLDQLADGQVVPMQLLRPDRATPLPLNLVVVNTPASIEQGLSGQPSMPADGMLFVLPSLRIPAFWMIDMQFDLDMIWLHDLTVVDTTQNVSAPAPNTPAYQLQTYSPTQPANQVLEVPAGFVTLHGIQPGDQLQFP